MRPLILALASAGGLGYIPIAPGTFGTLAGIPLVWAFEPFRLRAPVAYCVAVVVLVLAACWIAGRAEQLLGEHDSRKIVIDEVAGYLAATLFLAPSWQVVVIAFLVFRLFDILKPFPAGYIDRKFPGGYGVVLDDVVSGLYANIVTRLLLLWV